jgi:hypothetical protein
MDKKISNYKMINKSKPKEIENMDRFRWPGLFFCIPLAAAVPISLGISLECDKKIEQKIVKQQQQLYEEGIDYWKEGKLAETDNIALQLRKGGGSVNAKEWCVDLALRVGDKKLAVDCISDLADYPRYREKMKTIILKNMP